MINKKLFSFLIAFLIAGMWTANAQVAKLIEKVESKPGEPVISYSKYEYPNGLVLIVHEDHSDPIVHVEVTYHVGSAREVGGRSGFAHLFEHMMFQGSEHVRDEEHFKIIQSAGGTMNGTTDRDRTNYYQTVPSNMLETALWLEADRMGFLLDSLTKEKFEIQRSTVKNEKAQGYDVPYGYIAEVLHQLLYPKGHPYSWPVIGFTDDLDAADIEDVKKFFMRWYGPNNAVVVVSGDVNTEDVVNKVGKYFGSINRGEEVVKMAPPQFRLPEPVFRKELDDIPFPMNYIVYPTVPHYHRDEAPLDMLYMLLGEGRNSPLYKNLVKTEEALQATMFHYCSELSGEFTVQVISYPGDLPKDARDLVLQTINEFNEDSFNEEDLLRVKESMISNFYGYFESIAGKSSYLSNMQLHMADRQHNVDKEIERYKKVTKADVIRVFNQYIKGKNYACVTVERDPKYDDPKVKKPPFKSFNPYAGQTPDYSDYKNLSYVRPVDTFDRSKKPGVGPSKPAIIPDYYQTSLSNGVQIIGTDNPETPRVLFMINIEGGHLFEDGKKVPFGTAYMTAAMLNESTQKYPAADLEAAIEKLGSSISFSGGPTGITGYVTCYKDKVSQTLELLEQMLLFPNFETEDFNLLKKQMKEDISYHRHNPAIVGSKVLGRLLYGEKTPLGVYYTGNYGDFVKISLNDVSKYYNNFICPKNTKITIVGDVSKADAEKHLSFLNNWDVKNVEVPKFDKFPTFNKTQIFAVNKNYSEQSLLMMGYRAFPYDAYGDYLKARAMNFALGGNFNSRLNLSIREEKGWTYGIRSGFSPNYKDLPGNFTIFASVKARATDSALVEIINIVQDYKDKGMTKEEWEFTQKAMIGADALNYETSFDKAGFLYTIANRGLERNYASKQAEIIRSISLDEINNFAKAHLHPENMVIVVVGTVSALKDKLEALGYGKVQVLNTNAEGKVKVYK
jgi:zinc protease